MFGSEDPSDDHLPPEQKRKRTSRFDVKNVTEIESPKNPEPSNDSDIQDLLESTMKQIAERKKQTQALLANQKLPPAGILPTPGVPPTHPLLLQGIAPSPEINEAMEKARKAAEVCICV